MSDARASNLKLTERTMDSGNNGHRSEGVRPRVLIMFTGTSLQDGSMAYRAGISIMVRDPSFACPPYLRSHRP
jgi:hypothetical protein